MTELGNLPSGWSCFHRRLLLTINGLFLATMAVFLTFSYLGERKGHFRSTFLHLDETLGVIVDPVRHDGSLPRLRELESQLARRTGVPHRLLVVGAPGPVEKIPEGSPALPVSDPPPRLRSFGEPGEAWSIATIEDSDWLVSSTKLSESGDRKLLLARKKPAEWVFAKRFAGFHGLHVLVTVALFTALLELVGKRHVRRPIEELATHIEQLESGRFGIQPEIARNDELGWLARRFSSMSEHLEQMIIRRVRAEKYVSAYASAWKSVSQMMAPIHNLDRDLLFLEGIEELEEEIRTVVASLRKDQRSLVTAAQSLLDVEPPEGVDLME